MEWHQDLREVDGLRRWYGEQPKLVRIACGRMLNAFAFGTRIEAIRVIDREMTVRNERFVRSRMQVTKASTRSPVPVQRSLAGSVAKPRFSGWVEQETGEPTQRNRFATLLGRSGDEQKQMRHIVRLKPKHDVITPEDYDQKGGARNIGGFKAMVIRKGENRLIRIKGGIYKRRRKKLELVQSLKRKQPKRLRWLRRARAIYFKKTDLDRLWRRTVDQLVQPPRKM